MSLKRLVQLALLLLPIAPYAQELPHLEKQELPHLEKQTSHGETHYAMVVDNKPFLLLGAQINNSSSWASTLPDVWPALEDLHVNTVEAPVYWEQMEPQPNHFDFTGADLLIDGAREHHLHLVLLWFGTWKNGQNHYVPDWIKSDPDKYPREQTAYGKLLDVMSPNSTTNLEADKHAFAALMHHLREKDGAQHTVIMIQVENESGSVGSVRDFSPAAQRLFDVDVPKDLASALGRPAGSWRNIFGPDADEDFAAYSTAAYINQVAAAGKAEYPLPMYCNVWITYPVHALENRDHPSPGQEYPSGGAQQQNLAIWKAAAPSIDILAPDYYSSDDTLFHQVVAAYDQPDNALFIPETGLNKLAGRYLFYALGHGAIGFSPFGVDYTGWTVKRHELIDSLAENYALIEPIEQQIAQWNLEGKLQTSVEQPGMARREMYFTADSGGEGPVDAIVSFGFPQQDGAVPPGTGDSHGRALVAQIAPMDFLVTGFDASVSFRLTPSYAAAHNLQLEILRAEEGTYVDGVWKMSRIWNGDQTDRGLNFPAGNTRLVRIRLHTLPLHAKAQR